MQENSMVVNRGVLQARREPMNSLHFRRTFAVIDFHDSVPPISQKNRIQRYAWSIWREHARTYEPNIKSLLSCIDPRKCAMDQLALQYDILPARYCWLSYVLDVEVVHSPFQTNDKHDGVICRHHMMNRHWHPWCTFGMFFYESSTWVTCSHVKSMCKNVYIYIHICIYKCVHTNHP